jgi:intracellular sulfur oxidation DsrE/DsrF family protein
MRSIRRRWLLAPLLSAAAVVPFALTLLLTGASSAPPSKAPSQAAPTMPRPAHRVALPINSEDAVAMKAVLTTALYLTAHYQSRNETFSMEVVAYSAGVHMFRADTSPVRDLLAKLRSTNPQARFVVCEATKAGMERNEGRQVPLFDGVDLVPNGPAHLIELQEAGWSYIRT